MVHWFLLLAFGPEVSWDLKFNINRLYCHCDVVIRMFILYSLLLESLPKEQECGHLKLGITGVHSVLWKCVTESKRFFGHVFILANVATSMYFVH